MEEDDPLTAIAAISTLAGGLGGLFGSENGFQRVPVSPELQQVFSLLRNRAEFGLGEDFLDQQRTGLRRQVGAEARGLGQLRTDQIRRQGGGGGAVSAALGRIDQQRLGAIASGETDLLRQDQSARSEALRSLSFLAPQLNQFIPTETGGGFASLFGGGLSALLQLSQQQSEQQFQAPSVGGQ